MNRIIISSFLSALGNWAGLISITAYVFSIRSSVYDISIIYSINAVAFFLGGHFTKFISQMPFKKVGHQLAFIDVCRGVILLALLLVEKSVFFTSITYFTISLLSIPHNAILSSYIRNNFEKEKWGRQFSYSETGNRLAMLFGPACMGIVISYLGIYSGVIIDSMSFFVSAIIIFSFGKSYVNISEKNSSFSLFKILSKLSIEQWSYFITIFLIGISGGLINTVEFAYAHKILDGSTQLFGLMVGICGFGGITALLWTRSKINIHNACLLTPLSLSISATMIFILYLNRYRRLSKSYERNTDSCEAWIYIAMIRLMLRRLD